MNNTIVRNFEINILTYFFIFLQDVFFSIPFWINGA
jgi:hypothetical protein